METTACVPGFHFDGAKKDCATACGTDILICTKKAAEPDDANSCKPGYFKDTTKCTKCKDDFTLTCTSATKALTCVPGYGLNSDVCTKCTNGNTAICTKDKVGESEVCSAGFILDT